MGNQDWHHDQRRRQPMLRDGSASGSGKARGSGGFEDDTLSVERSHRGNPQAPRRRWWQALVVAMAAIIVIAGGFGVFKANWFSPARTTSVKPTPTPSPIQPLLSIDTSTAETCPTGVAWSPDALKIAVASDGEQSSCDTADPGRTQALTLYDARSGALLKIINVHETLTRLNISASSAYAGQPSWSPDGSMIVVPFDLLDTAGQHSELLVIPVGSGAPRALLDTTGTHLARPIWNLKTGKLVATQTRALPQALTYTWTADGTIQPGRAAPSGVATSYTGSPVAKAGNASFSRWQSGAITPALRAGYGGAPFAWFHYDTGALWSPDGQYVAPDYSIVTRLPDLVGTAQAALQPQDSTCAEFASNGSGETTDVSLATTYCGQGTLPYPDAAYAAVVTAARAGTQEKDGSGHTVTGWLPVEISWRADGKVLATMLPADDFAAHPSVVRVTLYDTATGKVLATLSHTVALPSAQVNSPFYLSWSPTGQQLALVNNGDSQVIIWGASSLASLPPVAP